MSNTPAPLHDTSAVRAEGLENATLNTSSINFAVQLLTFSLLSALLYWGKVVAIPLALSILLSFTLKPVVQWLQRCHVPRLLAVTGTVGISCAIVACIGWIIGSQLMDLSNQLPSYRANISAKVKSLRGMMKGGAVEKIQGTMEKVAQDLDQEKSATTSDAGISTPEMVTTAGQTPIPVYLSTPKKILDMEAVSALLPIIDPLTTAALVLILVILMLLRWEDLRSRLISFSGHQSLTIATRACDDAGKRITRYLTMQLILNGSYGLVFAIGLYFVGVPYASLWGLCAALFRYLPYVGPTVGAALPVIYSLITSDGWTQPLWVGGIILVLELVSNNVLEPWLYGSRLGLSEVGLIMAAVAWTFLWGPVGLVLATPLTVCLVVLGEYIPSFSIFSRLLGDIPVMDLHYRFYQRLLARDENEALDLARAVYKEKGESGVIDELFIPALTLAQRDKEAGLLDAEEQTQLSLAFNKVFDKTRTEIKEKIEKEEKGEADDEARGTELPQEFEKEGNQSVPVVVWAMVPFANCAVALLNWSLSDTDARIIALGPETLSSEAVEMVRKEVPAAFCMLSFTGSGSLGRRERQLAKRMVAALGDVPLIAARLGPSTASADMDTREELKISGATAVTATMGETCITIRPFVQHAAMHGA